MSDAVETAVAVAPDDDTKFGWKVTSESASDYVIANGDQSMKVKVGDMADTLDLMEAAGDASTNAAWLNLALAIASVTEINGAPVPIPMTKDKIKARARELGNVRCSVAIWVLFHRQSAAAATVDAAKN